MRRLMIVFICFTSISLQAQDDVLVLATSMFDSDQKIMLADTGNWVFKKGHDISWADPQLATHDWDTLRPYDLKAEMADENGLFEGWFRIKIRIDSSFKDMNIGIIQKVWAATDIYIDGDSIHSFGNTGLNGEAYHEYERVLTESHDIPVVPGKEFLLAIHVVDQVIIGGRLKSEVYGLGGFINITGPEFDLNIANQRTGNLEPGTTAALSLLALLFWALFFMMKSESLLMYIAITVTCFAAINYPHLLDEEGGISFGLQRFYDELENYLIYAIIISIPLTIAKAFGSKIHYAFWLLAGLFLLIPINRSLHIFPDFDSAIQIPLLISAVTSFYLIFKNRKQTLGSKRVLVIGLMITVTSVVILVTFVFIGLQILGLNSNVFNEGFVGVIFYIITTLVVLGLPLGLFIYVVMRFKEMYSEVETKALELIKVTEEKQELLTTQNQELEKKVAERTEKLNDSLEDLKSTQTQLIHSEKMASLGELTAGIAHEIQNPLNFVNNFSEVSAELVDEMSEELDHGNLEDAKEITTDLKQNLEKINHHGQRASSIVKGMLEHSRTGDGTKELTDINKLADEYLRLSYHGLRAKDKSFNADFTTDFDESIPKIEVVPQDIGRVLLNLINNAFQVVSSKALATEDSNYKPTVTVSTKQLGDKIQITVKDNGSGIPENIKDKIFEPFFTTKPTGQGTGLGLSMSYDIITKGHGGTLVIENNTEDGALFKIELPYN